MLRKKSIGRRVIGAGILLTLGSLAGAAFPGPAASESQTCALQLCTGPIDNPYCTSTTNLWYCDMSGPGSCITRNCEGGGLECPPGGICRE